VITGEKVQLALIGSRPLTFQPAIGEPCTLLLRLRKGGTKHHFAGFASKFQLPSATKFLCVKTSCGKVVATLFLCLTVHRWISGDVRKFELKVTHPSENADFDKFRLIVPQP